MHCPQCGQPVIADDARFCKHCGLALTGIKALLIPSESTPDHPPSLLNLPVGADPRSLKGVNQAVYLMLVAFLPFLLMAAQGLFSFALLPVMLLMKLFFALLALPVIRFGYALYEAKQEWRSKNKSPIGRGTPEPELLPTQRSSVAAFIDRRLDPTEIVEPPSVTESTTKLLNPSPDP